jgi:hypothetical protein
MSADEDKELLAKVRALGQLPGYPTKLCQFCVQPIPLDATVCKFCTRDVNTSEEVTDLIRNYFKNLLKQREERGKRRILQGLGIVAIIFLLYFLRR